VVGAALIGDRLIAGSDVATVQGAIAAARAEQKQTGGASSRQ